MVISKLKRLFAPPAFAGDAEKTRTAEILNLFLVVAFIIMGPGMLAVTPVIWPINPTAVIGSYITALIALGLLWLLKRGKIKLVALSFSTFFFVLVTIAVVQSGEIRLSSSFFIVAFFIPTLLIGPGSGLIFFLLGAAALLGFAVYRANLAVPALSMPLDPVGQWLLYMVNASLLFSLLFIARRSLETTLAHAQHELRERQRAESQLKQSQQLNQAIIEHSPLGISVRGPTGQLLMYNPAWQRIWAIPDEVIAKDMTDERETLKFDQRDDYLKHNLDEIQRVYQVGGSGFVPEAKTTGKRPGAAQWISQYCYAIMTQAGQVDRVVILTEDITERKVKEDEIYQLNMALEHRVQERTEQLAMLNKELEAFAYSVAHDLKAPLRGIDGYSELLLTDHADSLDSEGRFFLETIRESVSRMNRMIDGLLAYSRLDRRAFSRTAVDVHAMIEAILAERTDELCAKQVTFKEEIPYQTVYADPDGLLQAMRNLIDNAIKFSKAAAAPTIEIGGNETEAACILWVRDNGIGFDMQYHARIFNLFQRLNRSEDYSGTGIGLALVRKAMQRMGGRVWAESAPQSGATFYIEIPKEAATNSV